MKLIYGVLLNIIKLNRLLGLGYQYLFNLLFKNKKDWIFNINHPKLKLRLFTRGKLDWGGVQQLFKHGYHIINKKEKIKTIIDGGAFIGTQSIRFLIHHEECKIICVEANSSNVKLLKKTFNNNSRVKIYNNILYPTSDLIMGLSHHKEENIDKNSINYHAGYKIQKIDIVKNKPLKEQQKTISINKIIKENNIDKIDILKLDINGSEKFLFEDENIDFLKITDCIIIDCPDDLNKFTIMSIFKAYERLNLKFNTRISGENLIFIKSDAEIENINVKGIYNDENSKDYL